MFRFPDKPAISLKYGQPIPPGQYLCQFKPDGERCIITWQRGKPVQIVSRHNKPLKDAEQAERRFEPIRAALEEIGTIQSITLDAEHVCKRRGAKRTEIQPCVYLLDCLSINGRNQLQNPFHTRWHLLEAFQLAYAFGVETQNGSPASFIERAKQYAEKYPQLAIEGVVLKRADSPFIGSVSSSALNPGWIKVKWQ